MAAFNGKWKVVSSEKVGEFSKSIGITEEWIKTNEALGEPDKAELIDEIIMTDADTTLVLHCNGKEVLRQTLPLGKQVDHKGVDGRDAKMKVTVEGSTLKREQSGDGYTATYTRTLDGNNMTQVMVSSGGVTATRKMVKI